MSEQSIIAGKRILVVEDEFLICDDMVSRFEGEGAEVIGPVGTVDGALQLINETPAIDAGVLDVSLHGQMSFPVAALLVSRGIPFLFATGYDAAVIPEEFRSTVRCEKPVDPGALARALFPG